MDVEASWAVDWSFMFNHTRDRIVVQAGEGVVGVQCGAPAAGGWELWAESGHTLEALSCAAAPPPTRELF